MCCVFVLCLSYVCAVVVVLFGVLCCFVSWNLVYALFVDLLLRVKKCGVVCVVCVGAVLDVAVFSVCLCCVMLGCCPCVVLCLCVACMLCCCG